MQNFMTVQTPDDFPFGKSKIKVVPIGAIEVRASGLRYLPVMALDGYPFPSGYGSFIREYDMTFYDQADLFVTPEIEKEFLQYCKKVKA